MNQGTLQKLAIERLKDAKALLKGKRWAYAYYVSGYSVECALKSCVLARMVHTGWIFDERARLDECRTHDFVKLVNLAGLTDELNLSLKTSHEAGKEFVSQWGIVISWRVDSRYLLKEKAIAEAEAKKMFRAITNRPHGVLEWIKKYW